MRPPRMGVGLLPVTGPAAPPDGAPRAPLPWSPVAGVVVVPLLAWWGS